MNQSEILRNVKLIPFSDSLRANHNMGQNIWKIAKKSIQVGKD